MSKCLYCYRELEDGQKDFHPGCARKFFGTAEAPLLEYRREDLHTLAAQVIQAQTSLTGVQPKLSLNLHKHEGSSRLTIVGLWGEYIFKPQTDIYPELPENEDLTMHLAEAAHIRVVPHSLIRLADGSLGYITRRIDRAKKGEKIDMEDMCQLTLHPTEYKYKSSYEQIAKAIAAYSSTPKLDIVNFMQILLFSFVTGNNDMHLKNFSLFEPHDGNIRLTPAYDMLNAVILNPKDDEELALTLNGKKKKLKRSDFITSGLTMGVEQKTIERLIGKYVKLLPDMKKLIGNSFLNDELKDKYTELITERIDRIVE